MRRIDLPACFFVTPLEKDSAFPSAENHPGRRSANLPRELRGFPIRVCRRVHEAFPTLRHPWTHVASLDPVWLAGTPLSDDLVVELARRLQRNGAEHTAQVIYTAARRGEAAAMLDGYDRRNILAALDDVPAGFEQLHDVLLREIERHRREGA